MNRLESTIEDVHAGTAIHCLPDEWNRTARVLVEEIDRLERELAECRAAKEAAETGRAILQRECDEWQERWDALPASAEPAP